MLVISTRPSPAPSGPRGRGSRVEGRGSRVEIGGRFEGKQRAFLQFVLDQYVKVGVRELDAEKLPPLLRLKYHDALADAFGDLGDPKAVGRLFADFQKYLYPADTLPRAPRPPDLRRPPPR